MKRTLVLFDIDGTLLVTAGAGRRAITSALAHLVGDPGVFGRVRFDGKTDPQIVGELLVAAGRADQPTAEEIEAVCSRYVSLLEAELQLARTGTTLMPGVIELIDRLEGTDSVVLGLLTGNVAPGAALKLRAAGIDPGRFIVGAYGSDSAHRGDLPAIAATRARHHFGRDPRGHEVVIIGDTPADIACGAGIGARAVAVATGSYSVEELAACGPHAVFADLSDTDGVLRALLD
jgi:phosphoglycolate phosphatase-like HAD superfamily hydrolase